MDVSRRIQQFPPDESGKRWIGFTACGRDGTTKQFWWAVNTIEPRPELERWCGNYWAKHGIDCQLGPALQFQGNGTFKEVPTHNGSPASAIYVESARRPGFNFMRMLG